MKSQTGLFSWRVVIGCLCAVFVLLSVTTVTWASPTITTYQPGNGAIAPLSAKVQATFSEPMDPVSLSATNFSLSRFMGAKAIATGSSHALAVMNDGTVVGWGDNYYGQLAVPAGLSGVVAVAAGAQTSVALKSDGTVVGWGTNPTVPAGLTDVIAIAAGDYYALALKSNGTVVAWGSNSYGEITVPAAATGVIAIAAKGTHSLALKSDGSVVAWGNNWAGMSTVPGSLSGVTVTAIAAGYGNSYALKADGTVVSWGEGAGQAPAGLSGVVAISGTLALKNDGTVVAWASKIVPAGLAGVVVIAADQGQMLALLKNGKVVAWNGVTGTVGSALVGLNEVDPTVPASLAYDSVTDTATVTPSSPLISGATYYVVVTDVRSQGGQPLSAPVRWSFTAKDAAPMTYPENFRANTIQLPQSGQSEYDYDCLDAAGNLIPCAGTGQDGAIRAGKAWPSPRFIDTGNGTVTDSLTGLIWLKNTDCYGQIDWNSAIANTSALASGVCDLNDGSIAGQWRLPTATEIEYLVKVTWPALNPAPFIALDYFTLSHRFWTSTTVAGNTSNAWAVDMANASIEAYAKTSIPYMHMWPVRVGTTTAVPKSGQATSYAAGDDGALEPGVQWPTPRFVDNSNGTVTDLLTGLIWLKNAHCFNATKNWTDALSTANGLATGACGLTDGSQASDWRLPNRRELFSLVNFGEQNSALWLATTSPLFNVQAVNYWTSNTASATNTATNLADYVNMKSGSANWEGKTDANSDFVWPVRGGQFGTAAIAAQPKTAFFAGVAPGASGSQTITIANNAPFGAGKLQISSLVLYGGAAGQFSIDVGDGSGSSCGSLTPIITAGSSCTISVSFNPAAGGVVTAHLGITSSTINTPYLDIPLVGNPFSVTAAVTSGSGSIATANPAQAASGATASFTLAPDSGYRVSSTVAGSCAAGSFTGNSYTTGAIVADCTVEFSFEHIIYNLDLAFVGSGSGSVSVLPSPPGNNCSGSCVQSFPSDTGVTLTAAADSGSIFTGWSGCDWVGGDQCSVNMNAVRNVTAFFNPTGGGGGAPTDSGEVWSWGHNYFGQLGDGTNVDRTAPVKALLGNVKIIASGMNYSLALDNSGTVWGWGDNYDGGIGDATTINRNSPVQVISGIKSIATGWFHSLALGTDGTIWRWGNYSFGLTGGSHLDLPQLDSLFPVPVAGLTNVKTFVGGINHSLVLKNDGTVWAWGANGNGQLGDGTDIDRITPVQVVGLSNIIAIGAGDHSLALRSDGTVWAWGLNDHGQLGDGTTTNSWLPVPVGGGLNGVIAIFGGGWHSLALKADGTVWSWGNGAGATPAAVPELSQIVAIDGECYSSTALKSDGTVWQKGFGFDLGTVFEPVPGLSGVTAIAGGMFHTIALKGTPAVIGWAVHDVNQANPSWIDWPSTQHAQVSFGSYLQIDGTIYYVNADPGSWNGADFLAAQLQQCDQATRQPLTITATRTFQNCYWDNSDIMSPTWVCDPPFTYQVQEPLLADLSGKIGKQIIDVSPPITTAYPASGIYSAPQTVILTANKAATIYFTTDGTEPTTSSAEYGGPITISTSTVLKFFARDAAGTSETPVKAEWYTILVDQNISFAPLVTKTFGDANITLNATASSGLPVSYFSSNPAVATISGNVLQIAGAGSAIITAYQAGDSVYNSAAQVDQLFTVNKAASSVTLNAITPSTSTYGDQVTISATVNPTTASGKVQFSSGQWSQLVDLLGGSAQLITTTIPAGINTITAQYQGNSNYLAATSTGLTQPISKANQTITFLPIAAKPVNGAPFVLGATASSGLPITYTSTNPAVATISGSTVTIVGLGTTTIIAAQAGDGNYTDAAFVSQPLSVEKATAIISLGNLAVTYDGTQKAVTATTTPAGLTVAVTYSGSTTVPTNAGSYPVVATVNTDTFQGSASATLVIGKAGQTISFAELPLKTYGDPAFTVNATASSGLGEVSYASSNLAVATVNGATITIVGSGSSTITVSQVGDGNYEAASPAAQVLTVNKASATVTLGNLTATYTGTPKAATATTTPVGLTLEFTYDALPGAPANAGSYAVVGTINDANYQGSKTGTLNIAKAATSVSITTTSANPSAHGQAVTITAVVSPAGGSGQVEFSNGLGWVHVGQVNAVNGSATVTSSLLPAGGNTITARYLGDSNHEQSPLSAGVSQIVNKANQTITFAPLSNKMAGDVPFELSATATSGLGVSFSSSDNAVARVNGNSVTIVGPGTATIIASQWGNDNYNAAAAVPQTLTVISVQQGIKMNDGGSDRYFTTLSAAYSDITAGANASIQLPVITLTEALLFNKDLQVTLKGGYDASGNQVGVTSIQGSMTIQSGSVTIDGTVCIM